MRWAPIGVEMVVGLLVAYMVRGERLVARSFHIYIQEAKGRVGSVMNLFFFWNRDGARRRGALAAVSGCERGREGAESCAARSINSHVVRHGEILHHCCCWRESPIESGSGFRSEPHFADLYDGEVFLRRVMRCSQLEIVKHGYYNLSFFLSFFL